MWDIGLANAAFIKVKKGKTPFSPPTIMFYARSI